MAIDLKKLQKLIDDMSEEDLEKFFPKDNRPKGWVDIEEHLPMFLAKDIQQGFSRYKVKDSSGYEFDSYVTDHNMWYYYAKEVGITHWWNDKEWEGADDK